MHIDTFLCNARYLLENNMAFFSKKADSGRKSRSKVLERYFEGITRNKDGQAVLEWRVPSSSHPDKSYTCYISVEPKHASLFVLASAGGRVGDKMQLIKDADVRCFCTCPDFNWSGMKYNMKHRYGGYEEGHTSDDGIPDGSDIRPKVRDPRGKNTVCKHLLASFNGIMLNAPTIMKAARTAKFPKEYTQDEEAPQVLGRDAENRASGQINQMNGRGNESPASGEIGMANSGTSRKPVVDYPEGKDPITMLGESAPVKIPEAQEALDALANTGVEQLVEHAAAHRVEQGDHRLVDEREVLLGNRASAHLLEVRHCRIAVEDAPRGLLHAGRDIAKHAAVQVLDFGVNERHHVRNLVDDGDVAPHHAVVLLDDSPDYVICLVKTVSNFSLASSAGIDMCFHQSFFHLTPLVWYPFCRKFIYPGNF